MSPKIDVFLGSAFLTANVSFTNTYQVNLISMPLESPINRKFSVAPMMEWTDRHYRYFARLMSRHTLLYTEMVTTGAIIFGDEERHLAYNDEEHPLALQLGGSGIADLAKCAKIAEDRGYDEVNLNVGCPSVAFKTI